MKFIDMRDFDARPGRLTVWRPTSGSLRTARWVDDSRPASYLQEAHLGDALRSAMDGIRRSPSWLAAAFELPGPLDASALRTALLGWIDRHEALRSRLTPHADADASTVRMARATLPPGVAGLTRDEYGNFSDPAALRGCMEDILDRETDPLIWPSFVFLTVTHGDSTTVCVGLDHHNADGYSVLLIANEIRTLYRAAVEDRDPGLRAVGSYLDFTGPEREAAALLHGKHESVQRWRDFVTEAGGRLPEFVAPVTSEKSHPLAPQTGGLDWLLDAVGAQEFDAVCKHQGGNFFSGVLACLALAARDLYGQESFQTVVPVHTRSERRFHRSMGWYVGLAPVRLPVRGDDGFAQVLKEAGEALRRSRPLANAPLARVTEILGVPLEPRFMVSYMDIRWVPGSGQWTEWQASALRSRRLHAHEVYLWVVRSHEGLYLSCRFPDSVEGRATVPGYLVETRRLIRRIADDARIRPLLDAARPQQPQAGVRRPGGADGKGFPIAMSNGVSDGR